MSRSITGNRLFRSDKPGRILTWLRSYPQRRERPAGCTEIGAHSRSESELPRRADRGHRLCRQSVASFSIAWSNPAAVLAVKQLRLASVTALSTSAPTSLFLCRLTTTSGPTMCRCGTGFFAQAPGMFSRRRRSFHFSGGGSKSPASRIGRWDRGGYPYPQPTRRVLRRDPTSLGHFCCTLAESTAPTSRHSELIEWRLASRC